MVAIAALGACQMPPADEAAIGVAVASDMAFSYEDPTSLIEKCQRPVIAGFPLHPSRLASATCRVGCLWSITAASIRFHRPDWTAALERLYRHGSVSRTCSPTSSEIGGFIGGFLKITLSDSPLEHDAIR